MSEAAPWLIAMENGGLGEARAKALLMDRFWVLERSVDVEGADFLVQRRLNANNFMDRDPPRLGVVQVKFIQDSGTSISIHKSYVSDDHGLPFNEFFLLVFTGREDNEKSYLLSAKEIIETFSEIPGCAPTRLRVGGTKLMATSNYEITQKRVALDRIEHALLNADFQANRRFLGSTGYVKISPDHIDEDYLKPLDNGYANLQKVFFDGKKKLQSVLFDAEEVIEAMQRILRTTDPVEAQLIYDDEIAQHVDGYGNLNLGSARDFGFDEDFIAAAENHRARLRKLQELGLMGNYMKLLGDLETALVEQLLNPAFNAEAIDVIVTYDDETLANSRIRVSAAPIGTSTHVAMSQKGLQTAHFDLKSTLPSLFGAPSGERDMLVRKELWRLRRPIHRELDRLYLGDDLVAF